MCGRSNRKYKVRTCCVMGLVAGTLLAACSENTPSGGAKSAVSQTTLTDGEGAADALPTGEVSGTAQAGDDRSQQPAEKKNEVQPSDQDARYRQLVVGIWEDDYQGHRTMTLNEDGTATMVVELSGMKATLFAARLEFNMQWSLEDGRLKKRTLGGKPEGRVNMILKMMGDRVDEPILELTEDRLLLLDKDGETQYDWRRKNSDKTPACSSGG